MQIFFLRENYFQTNKELVSVTRFSIHDNYCTGITGACPEIRKRGGVQHLKTYFFQGIENS